MDTTYVVGLILGSIFVVLIPRIWSVLASVLWRPYVISKKFRDQGIEGPEYKLWVGSTEEIKRMKREAQGIVLDIHSHDFTTRILPHYPKWISQYGGTFLFWFGPRPTLAITNPDMVKQVLSNKFGFYAKNDPHPNIQALLGKGLVLTNGQDWARHRRVVNPAFTMDKLKMMTTKMAQIARSMMEEWETQMIQNENKEAEVDLSLQFQELTADVISHTAFGSSYKEGKEVFLAQKDLQILAMNNILNNLQKWELERKVRTMLMQIIQSRLNTKETGYGNDLLGLMLEACTSTDHRDEKREDSRLSMDEIIDECKTFFFAGHETTSHLLTWTMLYGPVVQLQRKTAKDMELAGLKIPRGTVVAMPIMMMHRDKVVWGADADKFDPSRFENGVSRAANHPNALLSFSIGPRSCIGQNFAMLEAKTVVAMLLQRFSFTISPKYVHAPNDVLTLQPKFGLPTVLKPLHV
ncbi:Cytochrome P450 734A6 [Ananas comosus]|uniref:Cytochrome P450 734A6 n=1 Tax=Ananas comosus TaxID=4615 RepID=A0A199UDJ4_ANACO|nr:Cytochrome P450 734A6 [Ananas comosus]